jgi:hypothetical protein
LVDSKLSPFQAEILEAFFRHTSSFHLTGGAALAGYHLGHRTTEDLDLFTHEEAIEEGDQVLQTICSEVGATIEKIRTAPDFRRRLVTRGDETVIVDIVLDRVPGNNEKLTFGNVRVDTLEEIMANKLCSVLARCESRDLVDVMALDRAGISVEDSIPLAMDKDTGLTPAQLAWVLSQVSMADDAHLPGDVDARELMEFLTDLQGRLSRLAFPTETSQ